MNLKKHFSRLRLILFIIIFIKGITWSLLTPLWHFPDEQAHFGHVAYLAEGGPLPLGRKPDLTEEIYISEDILGTSRDIQGNNRFTFHPEYRLDYSQTLTGPRETEIKSLPAATKTNFITYESAYYPHFYYRISSFVYKLFYSSNLFIRVFAIRLFWLSAHLLMIWFVFQILKTIFPKQPLIVLTATLMTGLQPMLSFVASGVNSDNLHNLFFTASIYFTLKIIKQLNYQNLAGLTLVLALGFINKPQFIIVFAILAPALLGTLIKQPKNIIKYLFILIATLVLAYGLAPDYLMPLLTTLNQGKIPYLITKSATDQALPTLSIVNHFIWTIKHTFREVLPWYWGVFNWLGVVLPRWVNRLMMRLLAVAILGLIIKIIKIIKFKKTTYQDKQLAFIVWVATAYFLSLLFWDWNHVKNNGFSFGVQGRYYFPVISAHMILLALGIKEFFVLFGKKISRFSLLLLSFWFFVLQFIGLYTVANAYYDTSSFKTFIIQTSQYKPFFAKGWWLSTALLLYLVVSLVFIYQLAKLFLNKNEK